MHGGLVAMFLNGGWVMWPLLALSVFSWAVILERAYAYLRLKPALRRLNRSILNRIEGKDFATARQICEQDPSPLASVFLPTLSQPLDREEADRATERNRVRMGAHLKKNLWILGTIGSASPFIGLLGTVIGIIRSFHDMGQKGAGGFAVVSAGISEALIATATGLVVAIVALLAFNIFTTAANEMLTAIRISLEELIDENYRQSRRLTHRPT